MRNALNAREKAQKTGASATVAIAAKLVDEGQPPMKERECIQKKRTRTKSWTFAHFNFYLPILYLTVKFYRVNTPEHPFQPKWISFMCLRLHAISLKSFEHNKYLQFADSKLNKTFFSLSVIRTQPHECVAQTRERDAVVVKKEVRNVKFM